MLKIRQYVDILLPTYCFPLKISPTACGNAEKKLPSASLHFVRLFLLPKPSKHGLLHRTEDILISRAPAQMPGH